jgi:hypothetical protein
MLVTAGPTYEAIDPVRGITNLSSPARWALPSHACRRSGCEVTLVAGPVALPTPRGVTGSTCAVRATCCGAVLSRRRSPTCSWPQRRSPTWRPAGRAADQKIKKAAWFRVTRRRISMVENPDILAAVGARPDRSGGLFCVGFAAESHDLLPRQAKRSRKNVPLLVGNIGPATLVGTTTRCCWWTRWVATEAAADKLDAGSQADRSNRPKHAGNSDAMSNDRRQDHRPAHGGAAAGLCHAGQRRPRPARLPGCAAHAGSPTPGSWCPPACAIHLADPGWRR